MSHVERTALLCSPIGTGHLQPMLGVARTLKSEGYTVYLAISGDANDLASKHAKAVEESGAILLDMDKVKLWEPKEKLPGTPAKITNRAADCHEEYTKAILEMVKPLPEIVVYEYFAIWMYLVWYTLNRRSTEENPGAPPIPIFAVVSGFPFQYSSEMIESPAVKSALERFPCPFEPRSDMPFVPREVPIISFSSRSVAAEAPSDWHVLGLQPTVSPPSDFDKYKSARTEGFRIVYISIGTMVHLIFSGDHGNFMRELYHKVAVAALKSGAIVIASTMKGTKEDLGLDDASLAEIPGVNKPLVLRDGTEIPRVTALPYIPQTSLLHNVGVDLFVTHGGSNSFHEALVCGTPLAVCPWFGDQPAVARAIKNLGIGECIASPVAKDVSGYSIDEFCQEVLPVMLTNDKYSTKAKEHAGIVLQEAEETETRLRKLLSGSK